MKQISRYLRHAKNRVKNLIKWARFGWGAYDFDYRYAVDAFTLQLDAMAEFMSSPRAYSAEAKDHAAQIKELSAELKRVYNDEYALAHYDRLREKWGSWDYEFVPTGETIFNPISGKQEGTSTMEMRFERQLSPEEIEEFERDRAAWSEEARVEQQLREVEVWSNIAAKIRNWWD